MNDNHWLLMIYLFIIVIVASSTYVRQHIVKGYLLQTDNEFEHTFAEEVVTALLVVISYTCALVLVNN